MDDEQIRIEKCEVLAREMDAELGHILRYWISNAVDDRNGGFLGEIDNNNNPRPGAAKGLVLNSRILWAFSAAAGLRKDQQLVQLARRAYRYIRDHFIDRQYGGAYWSVTSRGEKLDGKKQTYGIAFCIYGLSEYVKLTSDKEALELARQLYVHLERHTADKEGKGYIEAFTESWQPVEDLRLSDKDENMPKTTNTHLHVVEAYAALYEVWPDGNLSGKIKDLLDIFDQKIIDKQTWHLKLFFNKEWGPAVSGYSFGHDIEAAWLLQHCAAALDDKMYLERFEQLAIKMSEATLRWVDKDGALYYEMDGVSGSVNKEKHWWVQAEAMVGFLNAYQLTNDPLYVQYLLHTWNFIRVHIIDRKYGEWFWGVKEDYTKMDEPKLGFWKCPYHNARACLEIIKRVRKPVLKKI
ncbi:AGE family epimerase/isomerase [Niabella aquatica]